MIEQQAFDSRISNSDMNLIIPVILIMKKSTSNASVCCVYGHGYFVKE